MTALFGTKNTAELQNLDRDTQSQVFLELRKQGVTVRQFARLADIGRRVAERMAKRRRQKNRHHAAVSDITPPDDSAVTIVCSLS